jgi:hypothetical protein
MRSEKALQRRINDKKHCEKKEKEFAQVVSCAREESEFCIYEIDEAAKKKHWSNIHRDISESKHNMKYDKKLFDELSQDAKVIHVTYPDSAHSALAVKYLKVIDEKEEYRVRGGYYNYRKQRYENVHNPRKWDFKETKDVVGRKGKTARKVKLSSREKGYLKAHKNDKERQDKLYKRVIIVEHPLGDGPVTEAPRVLSHYKNPYNRPTPTRKKTKSLINAGKLLEVDQFI